MKIQTFTLPVSGYIVDINTEPSWGERKSVDNFIVSKAKGKVGADGNFQTEFSGDIIAQQEEFSMTILVKGIKDPNGAILPATIETINSLSIEDGSLIESVTKGVWEDLKKKSKKTELK